MWGFGGDLLPYWQLFETQVGGGFARFCGSCPQECGALVGIRLNRAHVNPRWRPFFLQRSLANPRWRPLFLQIYGTSLEISPESFRHKATSLKSKLALSSKSHDLLSHVISECMQMQGRILHMQKKAVLYIICEMNCACPMLS